MKQLLMAGIGLVLAGCVPTPADPKPPAPPVLPAKITQFYASPPRVAAGEAALLCYGVESAVEVTLTPPVEPVHPALARCFEVKPKVTTAYELTAVGKGGDRTSQRVTVKVGAARVKFTQLTVSAQEVTKGSLVSFCFKAVNATAVTGGPGKFQQGGQAAGDCLVDTPQQTTTYRLTVTGAEGESDTDAVTVRVK